MFKHLKNIIELIDKNEWNRAKTVWILLVSRLKMSNNLSFNLFDTEYNAFIKYFVEYQNIEFKCNECSSKTEEYISNIVLIKEKGQTYLSLNKSTLCESCLIISNGKFASIPAFVLVEVEHYEKDKVLINDIPLCFNLNNVTYNFLIKSYN